MERRALYVVLCTVLIVALVASVVFLNGNGQSPQSMNNSNARSNSTGSVLPINVNMTQPVTNGIKLNLSETKLTNSSSK